MITLRRLSASLLTLGAGAPAAYLAATESSGVPVIAWLGLASLPVAAALVFVGRLEPQILVRAVLWGVLVFGTLLAWVADTGAGEAHAMSLAMALGAGLGLLALGASGLDAPPARAAFVPIAFRGVLVAVMVMAIADTLALLFWGGLVAESSIHGQSFLLAFLLGGGALMLVAVFGLYRLQVWGFALNVIANLVVASGAWIVDDLPTEIAICLTATAVGQIFVGLPLMRGLFSKQERVPMSPKVARALGATVIVGLMISAAIARWHYA